MSAETGISIENLVAVNTVFEAMPEDQANEFIEDLGADSLDIVELIMAMEEEFQTEIPDEEAEKIRTVGDAMGYVRSRAG